MIKFTLCFIQHHTIKIYEEVERFTPLFLNLALDGSGHFTRFHGQTIETSGTRPQSLFGHGGQNISRGGGWGKGFNLQML